MRNIFYLLVLFTFASFAEQKINTVKPKGYMGRQITDNALQRGPFG